MSFFVAASPATPTQQLYYCHPCARTVSIPTPSSPDADVLCPLCGDGFVEEVEGNPSPTPPNPNRNIPSFVPFPFPLVPSPSTLDIRHPQDVAVVFGPGSPPPFTAPGGAPPPAARTFDPFAFLNNHLNQLVSGGASIQIVLEGGAGGGGANLGDYFIGPGLEQLIQQLAENDPNRYGTPPAAKSAVAALPDVAVSEALLASDGGAHCAVCMDAFEIGASVKQLPCKHLFHKDCILPWLEMHNSCPVCRFELPTDDPDYEQRRVALVDSGAAADAAGGSAATVPAGSGSGDGNSPRPRLVERRFRISLPWPFRTVHGSQAEASNAEGGERNNDGGDGSQPRQDDLD